MSNGSGGGEPESVQDPVHTPGEHPPIASPAADPAEAATAVIPHATRAAPTRVGPGLRAPGPQTSGTATAAPTRIPDPQPAPRGRRRWPLVVAGVAALAAVAAGTVVLLDRLGVGDTSESDVRATITDFVAALDRGDLAALRAGSCGDLAGYYGTVADADFADVYRSANADGSVPVLDSVDAVSVTGDTALAQVTVHTVSAPASGSVRSFALEKHDGVWKVCS
ncbi:hypothetical protein GCM10023094_40890 [Rhodococcus olei]|uniref:Lumazine-binding protein n=1 Tax=Rhodococcus olei TaxID=2161675 RepID=A0ABP8PF17_9NOCA